MNQNALNFYNAGVQNLMQGGQYAHGWNRPVAGVGLPTMANPNQPVFMAGAPILINSFSEDKFKRKGGKNKIAGKTGGQYWGRGSFGEEENPLDAGRGPFGEEQNPFIPASSFALGSMPAMSFGGEQNPFSPAPRRNKIMGYSQSQGAQTTRSGPLAPRVNYKPASMLPLSQRYSR